MYADRACKRGEERQRAALRAARCPIDFARDDWNQVVVQPLMGQRRSTR